MDNLIDKFNNILELSNKVVKHQTDVDQLSILIEEFSNEIIKLEKNSNENIKKELLKLEKKNNNIQLFLSDLVNSNVFQFNTIKQEAKKLIE